MKTAGLNPHIEDITRRLALDNFVAFAPDALTPLGGYPGDEDKARELFAKLDQRKCVEDFVAASPTSRAGTTAAASWGWSVSATAAA
jgi:carboxymethylenebutenolidase